MKVNALNFADISFKNSKNVKKNIKATDSNLYQKENIAKRVLIGSAFAALFVVAYTTRPKQLLLESKLVKRSMGKFQDSAKKMIQEFQEKADEVSNLIAEGTKNSFQDVYENSKLIRKFITKEGAEIPSVMEEYGAKGKLLRKTIFDDFKNFKVKEFAGKFGSFNNFDVCDGQVGGIAKGARKLPFNRVYVSEGFYPFRGIGFYYNKALVSNDDSKPEIFIKNLLIDLNQRKLFLKSFKMQDDQCEIKKSFYFINNLLSNVGVDYQNTQTEKGLKFMARDFYKMDNGALKTVRREALDREFLNDLVLDFIY